MEGGNYEYTLYVQGCSMSQTGRDGTLFGAWKEEFRYDDEMELRYRVPSWVLEIMTTTQVMAVEWDDEVRRSRCRLSRVRRNHDAELA